MDTGIATNLKPNYNDKNKPLADHHRDGGDCNLRSDPEHGRVLVLSRVDRRDCVGRDQTDLRQGVQRQERQLYRAEVLEGFCTRDSRGTGHVGHYDDRIIIR